MYVHVPIYNPRLHETGAETVAADEINIPSPTISVDNSRVLGAGISNAGLKEVGHQNSLLTEKYASVVSTCDQSNKVFSPPISCNQAIEGSVSLLHVLDSRQRRSNSLVGG
ncbi:hypothetical protein ACOSQ2_013577 [Xanthoceras sorbifolium]